MIFQKSVQSIIQSFLSLVYSEFNQWFQSIVYNLSNSDKKEINNHLKEMASNINSSISGIPESMRKRRESKNRIKRNQIYSTSYNRKGRRR